MGVLQRRQARIESETVPKGAGANCRQQDFQSYESANNSSQLTCGEPVFGNSDKFQLPWRVGSIRGLMDFAARFVWALSVFRMTTSFAVTAADQPGSSNRRQLELRVFLFMFPFQWHAAEVATNAVRASTLVAAFRIGIEFEALNQGGRGGWRDVKIWQSGILGGTLFMAQRGWNLAQPERSSRLAVIKVRQSSAAVEWWTCRNHCVGNALRRFKSKAKWCRQRQDFQL